MPGSVSSPRPLLKCVQLRQPTPDHPSLRFCHWNLRIPFRTEACREDSVCSFVCRVDHRTPGACRAGGTRGRAEGTNKGKGQGEIKAQRGGNRQVQLGEGEERERGWNRTEERRASILGGQGYFYLLCSVPWRPQRHYTASAASLANGLALGLRPPSLKPLPPDAGPHWSRAWLPTSPGKETAGALSRGRTPKLLKQMAPAPALENSEQLF